jgi:hypothetical protein
MKITIECTIARNSSLKINGLEVLRAEQYFSEFNENEILLVKEKLTYNPVTSKFYDYLTFKIKGKEYAIRDRNWSNNYGIWTEQAKLASNYNFI